MPLGVKLVLPSASTRLREVVSNLLNINDTVAFARELGAFSFESETEEVSSLVEDYPCYHDLNYTYQTLFVIQIANIRPQPLFPDLPQFD